MSRRAYPAYKPSGVPWLGDVPEGWKLGPLKYLVRDVYSGGTPESNNSDYWTSDPQHGTNWVAIRDMTRNELVACTDKLVSREGILSKNLRILPKGTLMYSMYASLGKVAVLGVKATINQAILGLVPSESKVNQRFLKYWLVQMERHLELFSSSNTQDNLNAAKVKSLPVFVPPLTEQVQVADYLDRETAKIDGLIAKKRELIERLKEKRTALISHVVTKGLPPEEAAKHGLPVNPPLKPSGVPWLGEVPEHWQTIKATRGFRVIGSGTTPKADDPDNYGGDMPWVTTSELREKLITETKQTVSEKALSEYSALKTYSVGTTLIAMYGATIGRLGILGVEATLNQACCAYAYPKSLSTKFMYYWLWMRRPILISLSVGGGQPNLSQDDLRQLWVPAPGLTEQARICDYLDREIEKLDKLADHQEQAIEKLHEYRSALMTAAVTGKIDVREEVPR